jgi:hypothetical protein
MKIKTVEVIEALDNLNLGLDGLRQPKRAEMALACNSAFLLLEALKRAAARKETVEFE